MLLCVSTHVIMCRKRERKKGRRKKRKEKGLYISWRKEGRGGKRRKEEEEKYVPLYVSALHASEEGEGEERERGGEERAEQALVT